MQDGNEEAALNLAECAQKECEAFRLGEYWSHIAPLEAAVARKDISGTMEALTAILALRQSRGTIAFLRFSVIFHTKKVRRNSVCRFSPRCWQIWSRRPNMNSFVLFRNFRNW
jgi:hypothetical protein